MVGQCYSCNRGTDKTIECGSCTFTRGPNGTKEIIQMPIRSLAACKIVGLGFYQSIDDVPNEGWMTFITETSEDEDVRVVRYLKVVDPGTGDVLSLDMCDEGKSILAKNRNSVYIMHGTKLQIHPLPLMVLDKCDPEPTAEYWEKYLREYTSPQRAWCRDFTELTDRISALRAAEYDTYLEAALGALKHEFVKALAEAVEAGVHCIGGFDRVRSGGGIKVVTAKLVTGFSFSSGGITDAKLEKS